MKKIIITFIIFFILINIYVVYNVNQNSFSIENIKGNKTDTINFWIDNNNKFITTLNIDNDTIPFIIDTGADNIDINKSKDSIFTYKSNHDSIRVIDFSGYCKKLAYGYIEKIKWGDFIIKNAKTIISKLNYNLLGGNILKNFCVKFDFQNNILIISKNSDLIPKKGIKIPFTLNQNIIKIKGVLINPNKSNNKNDSVSFILDTGYNGGCILVRDSYDKLKIKKDKEVKWIEKIISAHFPNGKYNKDSTCVYSTIDFKLGEKTFKNIIIMNNYSETHRNFIGTAFLSRFKKFTIDYPNRMLYLELPDDYSNNKINMKFSGSEITEVPMIYCNLIYSRINSLGICLSNTNPYYITSIAHKYKNKIQVNDTLWGIDNNIFNETFFNKTHTQEPDFKLIINKKEQDSIVSNTLGRKNHSTFYFYKNNNLIKLEAVRDNILNNPPHKAYSFGYIDHPSCPLYVVIKERKKDETKFKIKISIHKVRKELLDDN